MTRKIEKKAPGSQSILAKRFRKFRSIKRGYISFIVLVMAYGASFFLPLLVSNRALVVRHEGKTYFPAFHGFYSASEFGAEGTSSEPNYRELREQFKEEGAGNWVMMPLYHYDPLEDVTVAGNKAFEAPSWKHWLGTDDRGRDLFARMAYGFNVSLSFALLLTFINYLVGGSVGAVMGYFGGRFDLYVQRLIEIWGTMPFLYVVIIISSIITPNFLLLVFILNLFGWIGMTYYMRAEFYREKAKDYVAAAITMGVSTPKIIFKHILPNALTPIIAFFPFNMVGGISSLVALDFLGFGLPPPTPSWGQMVSVGLMNLEKWWLVTVPLAALFITLLLIVFIGEAIREAFDPKVFSRLR